MNIWYDHHKNLKLYQKIQRTYKNSHWIIVNQRSEPTRTLPLLLKGVVMFIKSGRNHPEVLVSLHRKKGNKHGQNHNEKQRLSSSPQATILLLACAPHGDVSRCAWLVAACRPTMCLCPKRVAHQHKAPWARCVHK